MRRSDERRHSERVRRNTRNNRIHLCPRTPGPNEHKNTMTTPMLRWVFCFSFPLACLAQTSLHTLITYNIRYDGPTDLCETWQERKGPISQQIRDSKAGIVGLQEVLSHQLDDLLELLPSYRSVGVGREDGLRGGEFVPIFYDTTRYTVVQEGTFWLSSTPSVPSRGWDAALNRICTYALFQAKAEAVFFWVLNVHFDHRGKVARQESISLVMDKSLECRQWTNAPVLIVGDFNMEPLDPGISRMKNRFIDFSCPAPGREECNPPTFNAFTLDSTDDKCIDYVFGSAGLSLKKSRRIIDPFGMSYPSDHFPLLFRFSLP